MGEVKSQRDERIIEPQLWYFMGRVEAGCVWNSHVISRGARAVHIEGVTLRPCHEKVERRLPTRAT